MNVSVKYLFNNRNCIQICIEKYEMIKNEYSQTQSTTVSQNNIQTIKLQLVRCDVRLGSCLLCGLSLKL